MSIDNKTNAELLAMRGDIEAKPENQQTGSIWRFTAKARKKLNAIDWAITRNLRLAKLARGECVNDEGYSGRQTNRR